MASFELRRLAIPSVCFLIAVLAYGSQILFHYLEPGPLTTRQAWIFNALVACIWLSYERTCRLDPGRLPLHLQEKLNEDAKLTRGQRWCQKCNAVKPPRAHHCKQCARCIPKMDHHCPWTAQCVSHTTFPHFLRFVLFACISLAFLDYQLYLHGLAIYDQRNLPSYLGPPMWAIFFLCIFCLADSLVLFALSILLVTATHSLLINTTMIETWEIERHEALIERSRSLGGYVYGPGGVKVRIRRQEFPYDIGFWRNAVQGMGTANILLWLLPFGGGPSNDSGWDFETNGFEDPGTAWPPIDPDKLPRNELRSAATLARDVGDVKAFKRRQRQDMKRWQSTTSDNIREQEFARATTVDDEDNDVLDTEEEDDYESEYEEGMDGEEGWTSRDGSRLKDFGVDEDAEVVVEQELHEDDIPLGELIRRRRGHLAQST